MRLPLVSSLFKHREEADLFNQFALSIASLYEYDHIVSDVQETLRALLRSDKVVVSLQGSALKGTASRSSDCDLVVETPGLQIDASVKKSLIEQLKVCPHFHPAHFELKTRSIACMYDDVEIDIVFLDTAECGKLPVSNSNAFADNCMAQNASRVLKLAMSGTEKVPSFIYDELVIEVQEKHPPATSLVLFCTAVQSLVDEYDSIRSCWFDRADELPHNLQAKQRLKLEPLTRPHVRDCALKLLRCLCASRVCLEQGRFVDIKQMELCICLPAANPIPTRNLGFLPPFLFGEAFYPRHYSYRCIENTVNSGEEDTGKGSNCTPEQLALSSMRSKSGAAEYFASRSPFFGRYFDCSPKNDVYEGHSRLSLDLRELMHDISELRQCHNTSQVAKDMLALRESWFSGIMELSSRNFSGAITLFGKAARTFLLHGDYFSFDTHVCRLQAVLDSNPEYEHSADAAILHPLISLQWGHFPQAESELTHAITEFPKMFELYGLRMILLVNVCRFPDALHDAESCVRLDLSQPMWRYWRGFLRCQMSNFVEAIEDLRFYVRQASQGCRKVCQAWYMLAYCFANINASCGDIPLMVHQGILAEEAMIPLLQKHEAMRPDSDHKKFSLAGYATTPSSPSIRRIRHETANKAVRNERFEDALRLYTFLIHTPGHHDDRFKYFSNRSLSYCRLGRYGEAENDAREVIKMNSRWIKGYIRLSHALMGLQRWKDALEAINHGLAQQSSPPEAAHMQVIKNKILSQLPKQKQFDRSSIHCWDQVRFKDSVIVVAESLCGDVATFSDALIEAVYRKKPTSIVLMTGKYIENFSRVRDGSIYSLAGKVQIIGEEGVELVDYCINASDAETEVFVENINMQVSRDFNGRFRHCILAMPETSVFLQRCKFLGPPGPAVIAGHCSSYIQMENCKVLGHGGGLLVEGKFEAKHCEFQDCRSAPAVEIREGGSGSLEHISISNCRLQAIALWHGGATLTLVNSKIEECGEKGTRPGITVNCGNIEIRHCDITSCKGDAFVVEADVGVQVTICESTIERNKGSAIRCHGSEAVLIRDNTIAYHSGVPIIISPNIACYPPTPIGSVSIINNTVKSHSSSNSLQIIVPDRLLSDLHIVDNRMDRAGVFINFFNMVYFCPSTGKKISHNEFLSYQLRGVVPEDSSIPTDENFDAAKLILIHDACAAQQKKLPQHPLRSEAVTALPPDVPPCSTTPLSDLKSCCIRDMAASFNSRAIGKILHGKLAVAPTKMVSIMSVLVDECGHGVNIALYNTGAEKLLNWPKCFPRGMKLGIREPFLRRTRDGHVRVCVYNTHDLVFHGKAATLQRAMQLVNRFVTEVP